MRITGEKSFLLVISSIFFSSIVFAASPIKTHEIKFLQEYSGGAAGSLSLPSDVAVDKEQVYIVDSGNHRLVVFDHQGQFRFAVGTEGDKPGQFSGPVGIDVTAQGDVYIADSGNYRIQIFGRDGQYKKSFQVKSDGKLVRPTDVLAGPDGKEIYITGNTNHKVMVFSPDGQLQREWGGSGLNPGEFRYPGTVALLQDNRLAVIDVLNTRVQVFDRSGEFSIEVGEWGVLPGQLFRPKGVAVDSKGKLYISDSYMNLIQVFEDTGVFLHLLKTAHKEKPVALESPTGIAISKDDRLFIAETLKNKVTVYKLEP